MIWSWVILSLLSIGIIVWMVISYLKDYDSFGISILCAFLLFLLGWLMIGGLNDIDEKIVKIDNVEIVETKYYLLIIDDENIFKFDTKKDFEYISDTTTFNYIKSVNMYGSVLSTNLKMFYYS